MDTCPNKFSSSQPNQHDDLLTNESETICLWISFDQATLESIKKMNNLSSNISVLQLDQAYALIRAG